MLTWTKLESDQEFTMIEKLANEHTKAWASKNVTTLNRPHKVDKKLNNIKSRSYNSNLSLRNAKATDDKFKEVGCVSKEGVSCFNQNTRNCKHIPECSNIKKALLTV